jgi:hypothetical protein
MSNPIPEILDTGKRVARTVVQAALAFVSLAPIYPIVVHAIGAPASTNAGAWLAASVVWVGTVAGAISRIMAIPAVNDLLAHVGLAGHSGAVPVAAVVAEPTTDTTILRLSELNGGEFIGDPAH